MFGSGDSSAGLNVEKWFLQYHSPYSQASDSSLLLLLGKRGCFTPISVLYC